MLTQKQLEEDVDDEGTVPSYRGIHTDYARCEAVGNSVFENGDGFVGVVADYRDRMIETRILFETLEGLGWTLDPSKRVHKRVVEMEGGEGEKAEEAAPPESTSGSRMKPFLCDCCGCSHRTVVDDAGKTCRSCGAGTIVRDLRGKRVEIEGDAPGKEESGTIVDQTKTEVGIRIDGEGRGVLYLPIEDLRPMED